MLLFAKGHSAQRTGLPAGGVYWQRYHFSLPPRGGDSEATGGNPGV